LASLSVLIDKVMQEGVWTLKRVLKWPSSSSIKKRAGLALKGGK